MRFVRHIEFSIGFKHTCLFAINSSPYDFSKCSFTNVISSICHLNFILSFTVLISEWFQVSPDVRVTSASTVAVRRESKSIHRRILRVSDTPSAFTSTGILFDLLKLETSASTSCSKCIWLQDVLRSCKNHDISIAAVGLLSLR